METHTPKATMYAADHAAIGRFFGIILGLIVTVVALWGLWMLCGWVLSFGPVVVAMVVGACIIAWAILFAVGQR